MKVAIVLFVSVYLQCLCESFSSQVTCKNVIEELKTLRRDMKETSYLIAMNQGKILDRLEKLLTKGSKEKEGHGDTGSQGKEGVKDNLQEEIKRLRETTESMKIDLTRVSGKTKSTGATYVRWGRHDCPSNGTEEVYKGFAAGSWSTHTGGSVNYVCLPFDPIWGKYDDTMSSDNQNMHGAEYMGNSINIPGTPFDKALRGHDVPCVVCHSTVRNSVLRIPGRNQCYDGWHLEYAGYLMAGKHTDAAASEYACVDRSPQPLRGGVSAKGGKFFFPVEGKCHHALKCPPYVNGRELTCAICTK